jgi:predicted anti-sigma-YlaC factor YlaD
MKCEEFEEMMADALGGELSASAVPAFEEHIAHCETCRAEYESLTQSLQTLQGLPSTAPVTVERVGDRLVISHEASVSNARLHRYAIAALRYAATILIAFGAGYGWHTDPQASRVDSGVRGDAIGQRFVDIHQRNPQRSHFAKCLMAVSNR